MNEEDMMSKQEQDGYCTICGVDFPGNQIDGELYCDDCAALIVPTEGAGLEAAEAPDSFTINNIPAPRKRTN